MGAGRDLYEEWCRVLPRQARVQEVRLVLDEFFPGCCRPGKGSHVFIVRHRWLKAMTVYPLGLLTVAVRDRRVPFEALRELVFAIGYVEWLRARGYSEDRDVPPEFAARYEQEYR